MARSIPKKTTSKNEIYRRITVADLAICAVAFLMIVFVVISALPFKFGIVLAVTAIAIALIIRVDALPNYVCVLRFLRHFVMPHRFARDVSDEFLLDRKESRQKAFGELFNDEDELRKQELKRILSDPDVPDEVKAKIRSHRSAEDQRERVQFESEDKMKCKPMEQLCAYTEITDGVIGYANQYFGAVLQIAEVEMSMTTAMIAALSEILRQTTFGANIVKLDRSCEDTNELVGQYFMVLFDENRNLLLARAEGASKLLCEAGFEAERLDSKKTALFLRNSNFVEFDASQIECIPEKDYALWSMPQLVKVRGNTVEVNHVVTHNFCAVTYPCCVEDGWLAKLFAIPASKCVLKCRVMDRERAVAEIKAEHLSAEVTELLTALEQEQEDVLQVSIYVTAYDRVATEENKKILHSAPASLPRILDFKEKIREIFAENEIILNRMPFDQLQAFLGAQISAKDPCATWLMPSQTLASSGVWLHAEAPQIAVTEPVEEAGVTSILVLGNLEIDGSADKETLEDADEVNTDKSEPSEVPKMELRLPDLIGEHEEEQEQYAVAAEE